MTFDTLLQEINANADTQRDRGTAFEYLVKAYLTNEPTYKNLYTDVWLLSEVPDEYGIRKNDTGVDLVAKTTTGEFVAVQAKFYKERIQKSVIDSFLAELNKDYYAEGMIVSTVDEWGRNAEAAIQGLTKPFARIGLTDLKNSQIDWDKFSFDRPEQVEVKAHKQPRDYQNEAITKTVTYFKDHDRGQLIMAPGTGKTFTSLKLAEALATESEEETFKVLYLVPSIQLLTQTLRAWNNDTELTISSMAVTSDRNASRSTTTDDEEDRLFFKSADIGFPATTSTAQVLANYKELQEAPAKQLMVVFSTYQSVDVLGKAQKDGFPVFDLIIADEAHRTTGVTAADEDDSAFVKVHDNAHIKGKKRLYQTATPRIYAQEAKNQGEEVSAVISSMDDKSIYGDIIYRLGFANAIEWGILTDYKLMVLAVDEAAIQKDMQRSLSDPENGLQLDDVGRIIGVWNGMLKRKTNSNYVEGAPMRRAIAFNRRITDSKLLTEKFEAVVDEYLEHNDEIPFEAKVHHADGTMNALQKNAELAWLADENLPENEARILSNVKFLTEGIDVPNLDAIIFMAPKKSQVDIVQAIGRIIRKYAGKDYGYIILPIVIPTGEKPENILDHNQSYAVIWQILNALRSVDERFDAMINKLSLNKKKKLDNLNVIGVGRPPKDDEGDWQGNSTLTVVAEDGESYGQTSFVYEWDEYENAIYGQIVKKLGNRRYLDDWSDSVTEIAKRHINYINVLLKDNAEVRREFKKFLKSLQHNINDSIDEPQAVEMLAQHMITKPIFDALFSEYSVVRNNPVDDAMEGILAKLSEFGFHKEQADLQEFYESVQARAKGIDNTAAKQEFIKTLYEKFFQKGFQKATQRMGIVFTPIEVVDFIVHSVDDVLKKYFDKTLASSGVHILDPFTGTGTFVVRTLQILKEKMEAGEITLADITRKYTQELHANEIVLLSYYIAAINIEATFDDVNGDEEGYVPFEGIVLTDTFQSTEIEDTLDDDFFGGNDERLKRQQEVPITVIMGNPPYSKGQSNENDNNKNIEYPKLFKSVADSYVKNSSTSSVLSMYDSYVLSLRWASNRLGENGVIGFVSNASYIDSQSADGLRYSLFNEFNHLYIFNLRGDARTSGEQRRKEAGNVFGSGSRTPIAISILVKDGSDRHEVHYHDIGDYLNREQKLSVLTEAKTIENIEWTTIRPDKNNDWINQRDTDYENYRAVADENNAYFAMKDIGIVTNRDAWVSNFSEKAVSDNVQRMISNYNIEVDKLKDIAEKLNDKTVVPFITSDETKISWSRSLKQRAARKEKSKFDSESVMISMYRPFTKKYLYRNRFLNENVRKTYQTFPDKNSKNPLINISGAGTKLAFSSLITEELLDMNGIYPARNLPRFTYESEGIFAGRIDNIASDDEFHYVYAVLHSPEYRQKYANDLQKALPRIPNLKNKEKFVEIGRKLANLHLNYEHKPSWEGVTVSGEDSGNFKVKKMKHPKKGQLDTIVFNEFITISNIPEQAYKYVVNGRPAIEWIIDQYQIKTDKKSGITDDPNEFAPENPRYILDLLLSVITVSMRTNELVMQLPKMEIIQ